MAQTTKRKRKKKKRRRARSRAGIYLAVILIIMAAALLSLFLLLRRGETTVSEPSPSVSVAPTLPPSGLSVDCFGTQDGYKTYVSDTVTAKLGVDISSHQGAIDFPALAASPVDFVILRAGYRGYGDGSINTDELFLSNLSAATEAGLDVGVYFFSQALSAEEAEAEAHTVLSLVEGYSIGYPIYFDWEPVSDTSARTATISSTELTACAERFCQTIEEAGYTAGIYFNLSQALYSYHLTDLMDYEFWLAEYQSSPSYPYDIGMWQYTNEGAVDGISTTVDLNLCFKQYGS